MTTQRGGDTKLHVLLVVGFLFLVQVTTTSGKALEDEDKKKLDDILPHYAENAHLDSFDQTLFLGGLAKAKEFRSMPEAERKKRFAEVIKKVDSDGSGLMDKDELSQWIFEALLTIDKEDAIQSMAPMDTDKDQRLSWFEYHDYVFGYLPGDEEADDEAEYRKHIKRARRTFDISDKDEDGLLSANEYHMFHNPRFYREMEDVVVADTLEDLDRNGDKAIDVDEFIGDFLSTDTDNEHEPPGWVLEERRMFETELDQDGNGKLEGLEIFDLESQEKSFRDQAENEADHLISLADTDQDGQISPDEAMNSETLFMGRHQTTHFNTHPDIIVKHNEL